MADSTAISAQGSTLGIATPGSPLSFSSIANFKSWNGFDGAANDIDATHLGSTAEEVRLGIARFGSISIELDWDTAENSHRLILAAQLARTKHHFKLTLPDGEIDTFDGFVKKCPSVGGVDKLIGGTVDIRITGGVTRTPA